MSYIYVIYNVKKPFLKSSLNLSLWKKWPAKISRFCTKSPALRSVMVWRILCMRLKLLVGFLLLDLVIDNLDDLRYLRWSYLSSTATNFEIAQSKIDLLFIKIVRIIILAFGTFSKSVKIILNFCHAWKHSMCFSVTISVYQLFHGQH